MNFILKILRFLHTQRSKISLIFLFVCGSFCYSQKAYYSDEIGISKLDANGMMSKIVWTKSKVAVLVDPEKNCIHVLAPGYDALRAQNYNGLTLLKNVETFERDIKTFHALDANDNRCILILTKNKEGEKEEQLRIYLIDRVYIYNFI